MSETKPKNKRLKAYKTDTTLDFGKYKGEKLGKVIFNDLEYIIHCIEYRLLTQIEDSITKWTYIVNIYKLNLIEQYKKPEDERNIELLARIYTNIYLGIHNENTDDVEF